MKEKFQALLIFCHPRSDSFGAAIAKNIEAEVSAPDWILHRADLYQEGFEPVLGIDEYLRKTSFEPMVQHYEKLLPRLNLLIAVYPDWWGQMPAVLKGWFDRVFRVGTAYRYVGPDDGLKTAEGLLGRIRAAAFVTSDRPTVSGAVSSHELYWRDAICGFSGMQPTACLSLGPVHRSRPADRKRWIESVRTSVRQALDEIRGSAESE